MGIDNNGDLLWATVFDYLKKYDSVGRIETYDTIVYTGIYAGYSRPTLLSLNGTNGNIINMKMFTYFELNVADVCSKNFYYNKTVSIQLKLYK